MTARKGKGKAAVKIRMLYGKLITDSRFYKPPEWKNSSGLLPVQLVSPAVCLHRSFAKWKWVGGFLDGTNLHNDRGV